MNKLFRICLSFLIASGLIISTNAYSQSLNEILDKKRETSEQIVNSEKSAEQLKWEQLWEGLTDKEKDFIRRGLLPRNYPVLKDVKLKGGSQGLELARQKDREKWPSCSSFSDNYGNINSMLFWAEYNEKNTNLLKFVGEIRRGDIILAGPGKEERLKKDPIGFLTQGPYHHTLVCVAEGPPPEFIDATGKGVVRTQWTYFWAGGNYRIIWPTEGLPENEARKAVDAAVNYVTSQLGKPYDLAFTDSDKDRAFYCSELGLKAYRDGAGMKQLQPDKSPARDSLIVSTWSVIDGLGPKNRNIMIDNLLHTAKKVLESKPQKWEILDQFIINEVLPNCTATENLLKTPENRKAAVQIVKEIREGKALSNYQAARKEYQAAEARGDFDDKWYTFGAGKVRKLMAQGKNLLALGKDLTSIKSRSGLSLTATAGLIGKVLMPIYRNLGTFAESAKKAGDNGLISMPPGVRPLLSATEFLSDIREKTRSIPILGSLTSILPGKAPPVYLHDFTSPTDLSQLSSWHYDYNPS